jgi:hypothetical protein
MSFLDPTFGLIQQKSPYEQLKEYTVEWNREPIDIIDAIKRIRNGDYPQNLDINHPYYGTVLYTLHGTIYVVSKTSSFGRSFANTFINQPFLLNSIDSHFDNLSDFIEALNIGRQKLLRTQLNATRKFLNTSNEYIPREVANIIYQQVGEKPVTKGAYNVSNSQAKINTSLFTNGEVPMNRNLKKINTTLFNGGKRKSKRHTKKKATRK